MVLLLVFIVTIASPPAAASDDNPPQSATNDRTFGNGILSAYATYYDADNSGGLSHEELLLLQRDRRSRRTRPEQLWDTNRDGLVSPAEVAAARRSVQARIEQNRSLRFDDVDSDEDGHLSEEEFLAINAVSLLSTTTPPASDATFSRISTATETNASARTSFCASSTDSTPPRWTIRRRPTRVRTTATSHHRIFRVAPVTCSLPRTRFQLALAGAGLLVASAIAPGGTGLLYVTDFEDFCVGPDQWVGHEQWDGNSIGDGVHGIDDDKEVAFGQTAFLGFSQPGKPLVTVARPLGLLPEATNTAAIEIDTVIGIEDSTNDHYDNFFSPSTTLPATTSPPCNSATNLATPSVFGATTAPPCTTLDSTSATGKSSATSSPLTLLPTHGAGWSTSLPLKRPPSSPTNPSPLLTTLTTLTPSPTNGSSLPP